jgi:probable selenium-dependent hydroxylase accessory protein YqeC
MDPADALLDAADEMLAVVGAGGKKTTLYALADALDRAVVTSTVRIPPFEDRVERLVVTDEPVSALAGDIWPLGIVAADEGDRFRGVEPERVDALAAAHHGPVLVKADGARTRLLKAPDGHEPRIPSEADVVVPIASARVVGSPLTREHVHRPERVASVIGLDLGNEIAAADVATVLASERGGLKDVPGDARVLPTVNMADDGRLVEVAREIADGVLDRASDRVAGVAVARMNGPEIVAVVE